MPDAVTSQDTLECRLRLHAFELLHGGTNASALAADLNAAAAELLALRDEVRCLRTRPVVRTRVALDEADIAPI